MATNTNVSNNYMLVYSNFRLESYSPEELELFAGKCVSQFLISVGRLVYDKNVLGKKFGFMSKELGVLSNMAHQLLGGVNSAGGYKEYCLLIDNFLVSVEALGVPKESTIKGDFRDSISKTMRDFTIMLVNSEKGFKI